MNFTNTSKSSPQDGVSHVFARVGRGKAWCPHRAAGDCQDPQLSDICERSRRGEDTAPYPCGVTHRISLLACCLVAFCAILSACTASAAPVKIIFDTDVGNDVDDVLALSVLHALQSRGECELLAVTITKPDELAGPFVDAVNTFYGRPGIPIGYTHAGLTNQPSKFLPLAEVKDGKQLRYPHRLKRSSDAPEATMLLRKILSQQYVPMKQRRT